MTDLSSVVSLFAFVAPRPGSSASRALGFRGPGRFPTGGVVPAAGVDAAVLFTPADATANSSAALGVDADGCEISSRVRHNGHFLASGESSGTSTTSLTRVSERAE